LSGPNANGRLPWMIDRLLRADWPRLAHLSQTSAPCPNGCIINGREFSLICWVGAIGALRSSLLFSVHLQELCPAISGEGWWKPAKVKCATVFVVVSFACLSHTFAVLRPLFPIKPEPPFANTDHKRWTAQSVKPMSGFCRRERLASLGHSLRGRVNGLGDTSKMTRSGLVLRSSSNNTMSQSYSPGWSRTGCT